MDDHEVKYIPANGSNLLPSKCKQWIRLKNKNTSRQLSVFISILSLIIALCFFTLVFTWLWGVPEKVAINEENIKILKEAIEKTSNDGDLENPSTNKQKLDTICLLPRAPGNCFASMPRWYFDNESKKCVQFQYSGCNGNKNNFHTEDSCLSSCSQKKIGDDDLNVIARNSIIEVNAVTKQEGEECGTCFSPATNFSCGTCASGLECKADPHNGLALPDSPKRCRKETEEPHVTCYNTCIKSYEKSGRECHAMCKEEETWKQKGESCGYYGRGIVADYAGKCTPGLTCQSSGNPDTAGTCVEEQAEEHGQNGFDCFEEPETGRCRALIPRFYHDKEDRKCKQFYYGGCAGNKNNFLTEEECQNKCIKNKDKLQLVDPNKVDIQATKDVCSQPLSVGDCRAAIPRWHYNEASQQCEEFIWGGCDGNDNNFASKGKCEARCTISKADGNMKEARLEDLNSGSASVNISSATNPKKKICLLEEDGGKCRSILERYFFNSKTGKCETFQYGGCGGNENNFKDMQDCEESCISK